MSTKKWKQPVLHHWFSSFGPVTWPTYQSSSWTNGSSLILWSMLESMFSALVFNNEVYLIKHEHSMAIHKLQNLWKNKNDAQLWFYIYVSST